nr:reverse transcriptase domain-containing protein [Tanacetum cinerariifolium]
SKEAFRGTELPRGGSKEETHWYNGYNEMIEANYFLMGTTVVGKGEKEDSKIMAHRRQSATPLERSLGSRGRSRGISGLKDTHRRGGLSQDHVRALFQHATSINSIKGSERCRREIMMFTVIPAPSPYNIILGRPDIKSERKKQAVEPSENVRTQDDTSPMKHILIDPAYPKHLVIEGRDLSPEGLAQLKILLKRNTDIFAWEPSDMTRVPKRIMKHSMNANPSVTPISQNRKNQHEAKPKEMLVWSHKRKVLGVYGYLIRHTSQPSKDQRHSGNAITQNLGEMQTLAGKLAALNRFLSRSAEKSLPFFETLKDITKKNKHEYRWTEKAKGSFQELKKTVLDLLALTTPLPKETLFVYLVASQEAVSAVLLVIRQGT